MKHDANSYPANALLIVWQLGKEVRVSTDDRVTEQVLDQIKKPWLHDQVPNTTAKLVPVRELLRPRAAQSSAECRRRLYAGSSRLQ